MFKPVPPPDGSYTDASKPYSSQDVINYIPEFAEAGNTRSPMKLVDAPGLREWTLFGDGPHRGGRNVEGKLFVVCDTHLYRVNAADDVEILGVIPGRSRVSMTHNQITSGNQVVIATGSETFVYDTVTEDFQKVTDSGHHGFQVCDYIAAKVVGIESHRRFFQNSAEADALDYDSLETYEGESKPDLMVSLIVAENRVVVLSEKSIEWFVLAQSQTDIDNHILFTNTGSTRDRGCAGKHAAALADNAIVFLGDNGSLYALRGYDLQRISTMAVENSWAGCDWSKAFATVYEDRGHTIFYLTFPDGLTWGYDFATRKFHRRQSKGMNRWRLNTLFKWKGDWYGGSCNSGHIYQLDWDYMLEACDEHIRTIRTGVLHDEGNYVTLNGLRVEFDSGSEESTCSHVEEIDPEIPPEPTPEPADYGLLYVSSQSNSTTPGYYAIDLNTDTVSVTGPDIDNNVIKGIRVNADNTKLYGLNKTDDFCEYDLATDVVTVLSSARDYGGFVIDATHAYVPDLLGVTGVFSKIELATGSVVDTEEMGASNAGAILMLPDASKVICFGYSSAQVATYDIASGTMTVKNIGNGISRNQFRSIALSVDGTVVYGVGQVSGQARLQGFYLASLTGTTAMTDEVVLPQVAKAVACHPDGLTLAVCNHDQATGLVWIYDTATLTLQATITVGSRPNALYYNADGTKLYVSNKTSGTVSVIDTDRTSATVNTVLSSIDVPVEPNDWNMSAYTP